MDQVRREVWSAGVGHAFSFTLPAPRSPSGCLGGDARTGRAAAAVLGEGHPLVAVLGRIEMLGDQLVVGAAAHAAGLALWSLLREGPLGLAVVFGAVAFEVVLGCRLFLLDQRRRQECVTLIAAGRGDLPLDAVARERGRLASPRSKVAPCATLTSPPPAALTAYIARSALRAISSPNAAAARRRTPCSRRARAGSCGAPAAEAVVAGNAK